MFPVPVLVAAPAQRHETDARRQEERAHERRELVRAGGEPVVIDFGLMRASPRASGREPELERSPPFAGFLQALARDDLARDSTDAATQALIEGERAAPGGRARPSRASRRPGTSRPGTP